MKNIKNLKTKLLFLIPTIILGISLDQITKSVVRESISYGEVKNVINDFFYLTYVTNTGGAWSLFSGNVFVLALISLVAVAALSYVIVKKDNGNLFILSCSLIVSGGAGNLIDRLFAGKVTDFLGFFIFGYEFPIFNVADILVVSGAIGLILCTIIDEYKESKAKKIKKSENKEEESINVE